MAILPILQYPNEKLHTVAAPVARVDAAVRSLIADMAETMYAAPGVGLAATQVDVHRCVIVIDISDAKDRLQAFVNPKIVSRSGSANCEEGCLSVPGIFEKIARAERITVNALNAQGQPFELTAEGMLSVCIQHEIEHLEGKVFVEHLSPLKQGRIREKLKKRRRRVM